VSSYRCWLVHARFFFSLRLSVERVAYPLSASVFPANFTRFYVLARSMDEQIPLAANPCADSRNKGLLRVRELQSDSPSLGSAHARPRSSNGTPRKGLATLLSALDLQICRLDRRPVLGAKTFAHVYIVEVDDDGQLSGSADSSPIVPDPALAVEAYGEDTADLQSNKPFVRLEGDGVWALRLREAAGRVVGAGGDAEVLGCW